MGRKRPLVLLLTGDMWTTQGRRDREEAAVAISEKGYNVTDVYRELGWQLPTSKEFQDVQVISHAYTETMNRLFNEADFICYAELTWQPQRNSCNALDCMRAHEYLSKNNRKGFRSEGAMPLAPHRPYSVADLPTIHANLPRSPLAYLIGFNLWETGGRQCFYDADATLSYAGYSVAHQFRVLGWSFPATADQSEDRARLQDGHNIRALRARMDEADVIVTADNFHESYRSPVRNYMHDLEVEVARQSLTSKNRPLHKRDYKATPMTLYMAKHYVRLYENELPPRGDREPATTGHCRYTTTSTTRGGDSHSYHQV